MIGANTIEHPSEEVKIGSRKGNTMEQPQVKEKELTIQQMAHATGLSAHTLRYYERAGLMNLHVGRDAANGYRLYSHQHVGWIEFIKLLRATGMPIRDIQRYTELVRQGEQTMPERLQLLKQHQSRVEEHMQEVEHHLEAITLKITRYEQQFNQHQPLSCDESLPSR